MLPGVFYNQIAPLYGLRGMRRCGGLLGACFIAFCFCLTLRASDEVKPQSLSDQFLTDVQPFLETYCVGCHGERRPKAKFRVDEFSSLDAVVAASGAWDLIVEKLEQNEMPPEEADEFPAANEVERVLSWYQQLSRFEAEQHDGDPGIVLSRRLSNAEYNYAIHDLTGVDLRPTREFPVDAANQAGFDNTGESLTVSQGLFQKYLQAARKVSEHLVFTPDGLDWSSHPVVTETDRDKYAVLRIVDFYQRQPTDLAEYFVAAWRFQQGEGRLSLVESALELGLSPNYLSVIWQLLHEPTSGVGPIHSLQLQFARMEALTEDAVVRDHCRKMRDYALTIRRQIEPVVENLEGGQVHRGSQSYVLWKNRQYAANRRRYDRASLMTQAEIDERIEASKAAIQAARKEGRRKRDQMRVFETPHVDLILPESEEEQADYFREYERFANLIPDRFYVSERGRDYLGKQREEQEKGRLLSAGFHSMMGYFRDDQPLYDLILDEPARAELDRLWDELDFITQAPKRQFIGFLWFERTDSRFMTDAVFDFARAEHEDATAEQKIERLASVYLQKASERGAEAEALGAIEDYFDRINDRIRWLEDSEEKASEHHLSDLFVLAERAYGRRLSREERTDLRRFYYVSNTEMGLPHEDAVRDCLVSLLVSPHFFMRVLKSENDVNDEWLPLTDRSLAQRLSGFLWSSLPDEELRSLAELGILSRPDVLRQQVDRMLRDERVVRLAREFGANWLDFRRFESHNAVDRERFPAFDDALRSAMFEEPIRFMVDLFQNDRPLSSLIYGRHTFANRVLAEHYGFSLDQWPGDEAGWKRVSGVGHYERGGLLPMSVFLTMNAPGRRTSPVKRGYWVARRLLGEAIPPPPPDVPELPADEADLGALTLSEALAKHREHANCASCHERFDSLGLVFEGFGPVGELRQMDMGGRPISTSATFPDGSVGSGIEGLREYVKAEREEDFYRHFCRSLLSYALGRSLILSDDPLLERMLAKLADSDYRIKVLFEEIVTSSQFLRKRNTSVDERRN